MGGSVSERWVGSIFERCVQLKRGDLLDHPSLRGERIDFIPTRHDAHVARTFALSYERLDAGDRVDALAQRLLARAAYSAPGEPIPRDLLVATLGREASATPVDAEEALGRLIDLGLLEEGESGRVSMHRLVARFARSEGEAAEDRHAVEVALLREANRLNNAGYPRHLLDLQPHLRFVVEAAFDREDEGAARLCSELGFHLQSIGDYPGAQHYIERDLAISEKVLGPEHPDTALSLNNLGFLLRAQGDLSGARPHLERALAILTKRLGPDHPYTKTTQENLDLLPKQIPNPDSPPKPARPPRRGSPKPPRK